MHLTSFEINKARRGAQKLLGSPHAMHAAVMSSFPPSATRVRDDGGRILWRVDHGPTSTRLYVVSPERPDLTALVEQAGWPTAETWRTAEYSAFLEGLAAGAVWGLRLLANPTHSVVLPSPEGALAEHGARRRGKRLAHVTAAQQLDWFVARAPSFGLDVVGPEGPTVTVTAREVRTFRRGQGRVTLSTAQFDGVARIVDASLLRTALRSGIGPAKGYGCGLMTLAPTPSDPWSGV